MHFGGGAVNVNRAPLIRAQMVPAVHDLSRYGHLRNGCQHAAPTAAQSPVTFCNHRYAPGIVVGV